MRTLTRLAALTLGLFALSCGSSRPVFQAAAGTLTVVVSAGAPVKGAYARVVALNDVTGAVFPSVGNAGELGSAGPTDETGRVSVPLVPATYQGPIAIYVTGSTLSYVDPSDGVTVISLPSDYKLETYLPDYHTGDSLTVPVTLWTTLADAAARAFEVGRNPAAPDRRPLTAALAMVDPLMAAHVEDAPAWNLRSTVPVSLTSSPQTYRDAVAAALPDIALNQLARQLSALEGDTPGAVITAPSLAALLLEDVTSDGIFDGRADGHGITVQGLPPLQLDPNTLRYALADALDKWLASPANKSSLERGDLQKAGVFDRLSNDKSILFTGGDSTVTFDNQPPRVYFGASFAGQDGQAHNPQLGAHDAPTAPSVVAGVVTLDVTLSDDSEVAAGSGKLLVAGKALPLNESSTLTRLIASFDSRAYADGPLTISVQAADILGNRGSTDFTLTVDNTPPLVLPDPSQPSPQVYYSAGVPVHATATDANGLRSFTPSGLPGFANLGGDGRTLVQDTWYPSTSVPDGTASLVLTAVDQAFNTSTVTIPVHVDRTPPSVVLAAPLPPRYVGAASNGSVTLHLTSTDNGAGVQRVYAEAAGQVFDGVRTAAGWDLTVQNLAVGDNAITIYAVDNAMPTPNSQVAASALITYVKDPPVVSSDKNQPAYIEESALLVQQSAPGVPIVPVQYAFQPNTSKVSPLGQADLVNAGTYRVLKAASRLSWGATPPTPAQLLGQDPSILNVPFLVFDVTPSLAPTVSATYSVNCIASCPDGTSSQALGSGALWLLEQSGGKLRYVLPLTSDLFPALAWVTGPAPVLRVVVLVTDAAGNQQTLAPIDITFHVLSPPVLLVEDSSYSQAGDTASEYPYSASGGTYALAFDASPARFINGQVRLVRYLLRNPIPQPVAVQLPLNSGVWSSYEVWNDDVAPFPAPYQPYTAPDGSALNTTWDFGPGCGYPLFPSCYTSSTRRLTHSTGEQDAYFCDGRLPPTATTGHPTQKASAALASVAYQSTGALDESLSAVPLPGGYVRVPPASGSSPGMLAIYVVRPTGPARPDLTWSALLRTPRYENWIEDFWIFTSSGTCTDESGATYVYQEFPGSRHVTYLASASSHIAGTLTVTSRGLASDQATSIGEPGILLSSQPIDRDVIH